MNTKEKILHKTLELFNQDGVEKITTRHVSKELNISQGNLHYHFPNKNVLIQELFKKFMSEVENASRFDSKKDFVREEVFLSMKENYEIMFRYRFLFKDNEVVWRRVPEIKIEIISLFETKKKQIKSIIELYKSQNIFREEISTKQINYLAEQFVFSISSWLTASEYFNSKNNTPEYFARFTFRSWLPYLKKEEMEAWEAVL